MEGGRNHRDVQHHPARDQHVQLRDTPEQVGDHAGRLQHLLEVVQHDEQLLVAQIGLEPFQQRLSGSFLEAKGGSNRGHDQRRISDWRKVNKEDAVGKGIEELGRDLERQAGLADAAGSRQRDQSHIVAP